MKKFLAFMLALSMVAAVAGCGNSASSSGSSAGSSTAGSTPPAASSAPQDTPDTDSIEFDARTSDELYEEALKEAEAGADTINVYSVSSRMEKACKVFEEAYPGLKAQAYDLDQNECLQKMVIEAQTGNINCDVLHCKDGAGEIYYEYYQQGYMEAYYPEDICSHMPEEYLGYGMPFYVGFTFIYYNPVNHPDGSPIETWWQLCDEEWSGNIVMEDPAGNDTMMVLFTNFVIHSDEMAQAYKDHYGKDLEYTYGGDNAGYEFMYRFAQQEFTFMTGGDDIVAAVGTTAPGIDMVGICSAGKLDGADEEGLDLAWTTNITPFDNVANVNMLYVAAGCDNPAGARLFIRYLLGDTDGQSDGFTPFTKMGNWGLRDDRPNTNNPFTIEESHSIANNVPEVYKEILDVKDFWSATRG